MLRTAVKLLAIPALLLAAPVIAGTSSLSVSVNLTVLPASGVCGSTTGATSISVACVRPGASQAATQASLGNALGVPVMLDSVVGGLDGSTGGGNFAASMRRLTLLPPTVLGTSSAALYSSGASVGGFRTIADENGSYVEITIEW